MYVLLKTFSRPLPDTLLGFSPPIYFFELMEFNFDEIGSSLCTESSPALRYYRWLPLENLTLRRFERGHRRFSLLLRTFKPSALHETVDFADLYQGTVWGNLYNLYLGSNLRPFPDQACIGVHPLGLKHSVRSSTLRITKCFQLFDNDRVPVKSLIGQACSALNPVKYEYAECTWQTICVWIFQVNCVRCVKVHKFD